MRSSSSSLSGDGKYSNPSSGVVLIMFAHFKKQNRTKMMLAYDVPEAAQEMRAAIKRYLCRFDNLASGAPIGADLI
jgi:hypothetical protein